jgi:hypothetical protein
MTDQQRGASGRGNSGSFAPERRDEGDVDLAAAEGPGQAISTRTARVSTLIDEWDSPEPFNTSMDAIDFADELTEAADELAAVLDDSPAKTAVTEITASVGDTGFDSSMDAIDHATSLVAAVRLLPGLEAQAGS